MPLHAQRQRLQAPQDEKTVERPAIAPTEFCKKRNLIAEFLVFTHNDHAADHVGMAIQIFRRGMNDNIEAQIRSAVGSMEWRTYYRETEINFRLRAIFAIASRSMSLSSGLLGVSIQTMRVFGLMRFSNRFASVRST